MPVYTYACTACESVVEKRQSFSDAPLTTCESCAGSLRRVIHPVGIVFKGSGWYINDSRNGGKTSSASTTEGKSETPSSDSKAESSAADKGSESSESASKPAPTESTTTKKETPASAATSV